MSGIGWRWRDSNGGWEAPLTPELEQRMRERLGAAPLWGDGVCSHRGADVREILVEEFGVRRSLLAAYNLLHRRGIPTCGRGHVLAEAIRKPRQNSRNNSRSGWRSWPGLTPGAGYASSFKTNRDSANRAP